MLALLLVGASACLLGLVFTPCGLEGTRSVYFRWQDACELTPPPPLTDLSCELQCPPGFFLNITSEETLCALCEENTYSGGSTQLFTANDLHRVFSTSCSVTDTQDCWGWTKEGRFMRSGDSLHFGLRVASSLRYYTFLERAGSYSLRYSKLTRRLEGKPNGVLSIQVNSLPVLLDDSFASHWQNFSVSLSAGPNLLELQFEKLTVAGQEDVAARVDSLLVQGAASTLDCSPCLQGFSVPGSSSCTLCPADHYLHNGACAACPSNRFAPPGSIDSTACQLRPPCVAADYHSVETPCENGKQKREYVLATPITCELIGNSPPAQEHPCEMCTPGLQHTGSECRTCNPGSALTETVLGEKCLQCSAGFYAARVLNFSDWQDISASFTTLSFDECESWLPRGSYLSQSGACDTWLLLYVNVTESRAGFDCQLSLRGPTRLEVEVDGIPQQLTESRDYVSVSAGLERGLHEIRWHYKGEAVESEARLHWVAVRGLGLGGAPECLPCSQGHFSPANSTMCLCCPAGSTNTALHDTCELCSPLTYSSTPGTACSPCPEFTKPSEDHTKCFGFSTLLVSDNSYEIGVLVEGSKKLCESRPCRGHLYGPLESIEGSFYLSVLNPDNLGCDEWAYAWGVLPQQGSIARPVSLGKQAVVETEEGGFRVKYREGALCSGQQRFSSTLSFVCDLESEGWPILVSVFQCEYKFRWATRYACPLCQDPVVTRSVCKGGVRVVRLSSNCVRLPEEWEEPCSALWELASSWVGEALVATIIMLVGFLLVQCVQLHRLKKQRRITESQGIELT
jgi:hypothetical protein